MAAKEVPQNTPESPHRRIPQDSHGGKVRWQAAQLPPKQWSTAPGRRVWRAFWDMLKRGYHGTYHQMSPKPLH